MTYSVVVLAHKKSDVTARSGWRLGCSGNEPHSAHLTTAIAPHSCLCGALIGAAACAAYLVQILFPASFDIYSLQRFYSLQHFRTFPSCGVRSILFPDHSPWHFFPGYITTPYGGLFNALTKAQLRANSVRWKSERYSFGAAQGIHPHSQQRGFYNSAVIPSPTPQGETACFTGSET